MSHIFQHGISIFKSGSNIFRVKDNFTYLYNFFFQNTSVYGISFDPNPANNRFFICYNGSVLVVNSNDFSIIATITGFVNAQYVEFDPVLANNRFFVNGNQQLFIVDATSYTILHNVYGFNGQPGGMAIDLNNPNNLLIATPSLGSITVLDLTTLNIITSIEGFINPEDVIYDQVIARNRFFVADTNADTVYVMDGTSYTKIQTITGGGIQRPDALSFDPNPINNRFIIGSFYGNAQIVDLGTLAITANLSFKNVTGVAFDPSLTKNRFLVCDLGSGHLASITQTIS